ncbi:helix-turn-helix domain-containing protein [Methylorubrum thiocyanatum]|uniref:helix-turn-helix domain-containing protein n=1 Tax=Methylorubrum thiocyanatum TaxID=47958 RepID=UPI00383AF975
MRFDAWEYALKSTCGHFHAQPNRGSKSVAGHFAKSTLLGIEYADFACDIVSINRTKIDVLRDDWQHLYLLVQISGQSCLEQGDSRDILNPGGVYLLDSTQASSLTFSENKAHVLSLHLPRNLMMAESSSPLMIGRVIPDSVPAVRRVTSYLSGAMRSPSSSSIIDTYQLLDLTRNIFSTEDRSKLLRATLSNRESRFRFVVRVIEENLTSESLSIGFLAKRANISKRQLERDFNAYDLSIAQLVRRKRLNLARELLIIKKRKGERARIIDVALLCGFRDISNFNRSFRAAYDQTPREFFQTFIV